MARASRAMTMPMLHISRVRVATTMQRQDQRTINVRLAGEWCLASL